MYKKLLLFNFIVIFAGNLYAQDNADPENPIPLSELEFSWKGPTVHKNLPLIQIKADEIPQGNYTLKINTDWGKTASLDLHIAVSGASGPNLVFPCYLFNIDLNKMTHMELYGLYYNLKGHLLIMGRYRIMLETPEGLVAVSWGHFVMIQKDFEELLTADLLLDLAEEEVETDRVNKEILVKKDWAIDTLELRDHLGNLIAQTTQVTLEGVPSLSGLTVKFYEDGKFKITGLGDEIGDIEGTYEIFSQLILFKCRFKGNNFKVLSRIMVQTEEEIVGTTNFETFLPDGRSYSKVGFQFQDTLRLVPKPK